MSKFTVLWIVTYCVGLLAAFVHPVYGTYTYLFEYYLRPSLHWWGKELPDYRWNLTIAIVAIAAYFVRRQSLEPLARIPKAPAMFLLALLALMVVMSPFAANAELSWKAVSYFLTLMVFLGLVVGTVRTEKAFDAFIAVHIAGAGWWGWEAYLNPKRQSGRLEAVGSGDTWGDNAAAAHLLTVIPFVLVYLLAHKDKRFRLLAFVTAPFIINVFVLCNSRGSVVGMAAAIAAGLILAQGRHRFKMIVAGVAVAIGVLFLADPEFIHRQQTTSDYENDGSATERLESWQAGLRLIADRPLGAGGSGFEELSPVYIPGIVAAHRGQKRAPHNTAILVLSEWGIPGFFLYAGFFMSVFLLLRQVRKRAGFGIWYYRALAIELSLVGLLVAGLFTDRLYSEAPYWMAALAIALHRIQASALQHSATAVPAVPPSPMEVSPALNLRKRVNAPAESIR
jgi:putative inorganic carbon (hco3(-)) transporter